MGDGIEKLNHSSIDKLIGMVIKRQKSFAGQDWVKKIGSVDLPNMIRKSAQPNRFEAAQRVKILPKAEQLARRKALLGYGPHESMKLQTLKARKRA